MRKANLKLAFALMASITLLPDPIFGQQLSGNITGVVNDSAGALLPQVQVVVVNQATNLQQTRLSDGEGAYSFSGLPIGAYTVAFSKEGFRSEVHTEVLVQANRTTTVKTSLQPGGTSERVTVTATPLLNETDVSNGYILGPASIQALPLGTGSFTQLATLSPGVNADLLSGADSNAGLGNQNIYANGQRDTSNGFSINGINANNLFNGKSSSGVAEFRNTFNTGQQSLSGGVVRTNTSVFDAIGQGLPSPPPETIQELRVNTSMYDAAQGAHGGAQIEVITRSGGNDLHAQVYEYFQNSALNAAPFFFNSAKTLLPKVPPLKRNVFGGTLGGPIVKDKAFFFASYQGTRVRDALKGTSNVSVPFQLTNDRGAAALSSEFGVPAGSIDPAALKVLNAKLPGGAFLIPTPTIADPAAAAQLNADVILQAPATFIADQFNGSIDHNIGARDRLSGKYYYQRNPATNPFGLSSLAGFTQQLTAGSQVLSLDNTTIVSPNLTWEQKAGFIRQIVYANALQPMVPADAGINLLGSTTFPVISISNISIAPTKTGNFLSFGPGSGISPNAGIFQNQLALSTDLNWVKGRHTMSFGANWDGNQMNVINRDNGLATLNFNSFQDFLTGTLNPRRSSTLFNGSSNRYYRANDIGAYAQDKFKLARNLTITIGVRFDYDGPLSEKHGVLSNLYLNRYKYDANTDTILNTGLVIAGNNRQFGTQGISDSTLAQTQFGVGPRFGIAWSPSFLKDVVFRGGFGLYYDRGEFFSEFSPGAGNGNGGPFGVTRELPFVQQLIATAGHPGELSAPFGVTPLPLPTGDPASFTVPNVAALKAGASPFTFGGYDPSNKLPYIESWSVDLQWQPQNTLVFTLGYAGNHGVHQVQPIPFNQAQVATPQHPINGQTSTYSVNPGPLEPIRTRDGGNIDLRVPFIGYSPNSVLFEAAGISNYNALLFSITKRLSNRLQINGSYTWSRSLDEGSAIGLFLKTNDPTNLRSSYAPSDYDRTHVATVGYLWQVPNVVTAGTWSEKLLNDWSLSGVTVLESGTPYSVIDFSGAVASIYGDLNIIDPILPLKPGFTPGQAMLQGTHKNLDPSKPALNVNAFTVPLIIPGQLGVPLDDPFETGFGSSGRNLFRAPFQERFDVALAKQFRVSERVNLQFRADFFNIFNHPSFDAPNNSVSLSNGNNPPTFSTPQSSSLGLIQHTLGSPRFIQLSLHLSF
jgi:hypothetical protein